MTNLKDKLSASVRQAKAAQDPDDKAAASKPAVKKAPPARKPAAKKPAAKQPAARKTTPKPAVSKQTASPKPAAPKGPTKPRSNNDNTASVANSSGVLFPDRVWPD